MAETLHPVSTHNNTPAHLQVTIDRLRKNIEIVNDAAITDVSNEATEQDGTATQQLDLGEVVYADGAGSFDLAKADALATSHAIGVVTTAALIGATATVATSGVAVVAGWGLTPGTRYYLSEATAGAITTTAPTTRTEIVLPIGEALSTTEMKLLLTPHILL
jgi:hypothetical protein